MPEKRNCAAPQGRIAATPRSNHCKTSNYNGLTTLGRLNATTLPTPTALQGAFDALTLTNVQLVWRVTNKNQLAYKDGDPATIITWTAAQSVFMTNPNNANYNPSAWQSVPEPATGALALAGVALLFKRRRA